MVGLFRPPLHFSLRVTDLHPIDCLQYGYLPIQDCNYKVHAGSLETVSATMFERVGFSCCFDNQIHQTRVRISAKMCFHSVVSLVDLCDLAHIWLAHTWSVHGRARCCYQGALNDVANLWQQAVGSRRGCVDL